MSKLTFQATRGTKTYHLPFDRSVHRGPLITIMVRKQDDGAFAAGVAVCSPRDHFVKRAGRRIAFERLFGAPLLAASIQPDELGEKILAQIPFASVREAIFPDLEKVLADLPETFARLERNRKAMVAREIASEGSEAEPSCDLDVCFASLTLSSQGS